MGAKKTWNIYFLGEFGAFHGGSALFPEEGALSPEEFGPFIMENLLVPKEVVFFIEELFLLLMKVIF
jgi:hypothetical protein